MVLSSQRSNIDDDYQLVINLDNVKNISSLLKAIHFNDSATFIATSKGIKVTVEDSKCIEAHAFIESGVFQHFLIREDQIAFRLSLKALLECLNIFGTTTSTALKMCYQGYGFPLKLLLEEGGVVTDCNIKTQDPLDGINIEVNTNKANKVILKADCLRDILSDLDPSSEIVEIRLASTAPKFRIATAGASGLMQIDIPSSCDIIESFVCPNVTVCRYKSSQIKPLIKMLTANAEKVSLLIDDNGLLGSQIMVKVADHTCYIEYNMLPALDPDHSMYELP